MTPKAKETVKVSFLQLKSFWILINIIFFKREQDKVGDKKKGKEEKSIERPKNPEGAYIDASFY